MPVPKPLTVITNMADAVSAANYLLDNLPKPFQFANGPYENLSGQVKPGATVFTTGWFPIVVGNTSDPFQLTAVVDDLPAPVGTVVILDADHGIVGVTPAPVRSLLLAYTYKRLTDFEVQQAVVVALSKLEFFMDPGQVVAGLYAAFFCYIRAEGFTMIASKYAEQINVTLRGRSEQRAQMSKAFSDMADKQYKLGDVYRDAFYERAGARKAPVEARVVYRLVPAQPWR
jgi:hypothetical protein